MALQKSEKRTLMIGGAVLVIGLLVVLAGGDEDTGAPPKSPAKTAVRKLTEPLTGVSGGARARVTKDSTVSGKIRYDSWGRDPFVDQNKAAAAAASAAAWKAKSEIQNLTLKGIVRVGNTSYVMVNDVILTTGQEKDGIYIESIEGNQVRCRKGGKTFTLEWKESS